MKWPTGNDGPHLELMKHAQARNIEGQILS
jgi:hypothetical protein